MNLTKETTETLVEYLFPMSATKTNIDIPDFMEIEHFTDEELEVAVRDLSTRRSPGGVYAETVNILWDIKPNYLRDAMNNIHQKMKECENHSDLGKSAAKPNKYRPLSFIDSLAKVFEKLIRNQLKNWTTTQITETIWF